MAGIRADGREKLRELGHAHVSTPWMVHAGLACRPALRRRTSKDNAPLPLTLVGVLACAGSHQLLFGSPGARTPSDRLINQPDVPAAPVAKGQNLVGWPGSRPASQPDQLTWRRRRSCRPTDLPARCRRWSWRFPASHRRRWCRQRPGRPARRRSGRIRQPKRPTCSTSGS